MYFLTFSQIKWPLSVDQKHLLKLEIFYQTINGLNHSIEQPFLDA